MGRGQVTNESRVVAIGRWWPRFRLSVAIVLLVYSIFAVAAHVYDPRWPPQAFGEVRTAARILIWPGAWIGALLVVTRLNPFPAGATYLSTWVLSAAAYTLGLFGVLSVAAAIRGKELPAKDVGPHLRAAEQADAADEVRDG